MLSVFTPTSFALHPLSGASPSGRCCDDRMPEIFVNRVCLKPQNLIAFITHITDACSHTTGGDQHHYFEASLMFCDYQSDPNAALALFEGGSDPFPMDHTEVLALIDET